ncbi:MAG: DUF4091 domain-containing protein [Armatimonadota bacterium]
MRFITLICIMTIMLVAGTCWSETMKLIPSSPLIKVLRNNPQTAPAVFNLVIDGARGETVSAQVILIPGDTADTVVADISNLLHTDKTSLIPSGAFRFQWVRYMDITSNTLGVPADELIAAAPVSIPDPFWEDAARSVNGGTIQPLWIESDIPANALPGEYHGDLTVSGSKGKATIPVTLTVKDFVINQTLHQRVLQWWDMPGKGFEQYKLGTDEYWKHLKNSCEFVSRHHQTDIRAGWELIEKKTAPDGKVHWDTSNFEKYAEIAFKSGIQAIQFWAAGRHSGNQFQPDSRTEAVEDNMQKLKALEKVVKKRKWEGRVLTSLADEPFIFHEKTYKALLAEVRKIAPSVGVAEAIETTDIGDLDIYVPKLTHISDWWPHFDELNRQGKPVWFYTCCHPTGRYPNRFLDQPLVKARALHWINYLYGLDGYLHWGLNWFTADLDPYTEKGANPWGLPPGDSQVAYPGKNGFVGSLRLSAMRDGLQDYEYLWTLENKIAEMKKRVGDDAQWIDPRQRPIELCRRVVQSFYDHTRNPEVLLATRGAIAEEIETLDSKPLLYVQTLPIDGSLIPEGPVNINIRGITSPNAKVTINDQPVIPGNISSKGVFIGNIYISKAKPDILISVELDGIKRTVTRSFKVVD